MSDYLTASELAELIDCKSNQRAVMIRWLSDHRWKYVVDKNGLPKVARAYRDLKLGLTTDTKSTKYDDAPNLQAFA